MLEEVRMWKNNPKKSKIKINKFCCLSAKMTICRILDIYVYIYIFIYLILLHTQAFSGTFQNYNGLSNAKYEPLCVEGGGGKVDDQPLPSKRIEFLKGSWGGHIVGKITSKTFQNFGSCHLGTKTTISTFMYFVFANLYSTSWPLKVPLWFVFLAQSV